MPAGPRRRCCGRRCWPRTSSIGVRETAYRKYALPRAWFDVAVGDVVVAVKVASRDGVIAQVSPEFDSVAAAADALGRSPSTRS